MAGHSKWANIKHRKGAQDKKRGKIFTKLIREITVAAKLHGGDMGANPRLRDAVSKARSQNMPKDTIDRAIKRGSGGAEGTNIDEVTYEGYGPEGVAVLVDSMTDNKTRTVAELRFIFSRNGGNLGEAGSVAWMFDRKGLILVNGEGTNEDTVMEAALEAGAEDVSSDGPNFEVHTGPKDLDKVKSALEAAGLKLVSGEQSAIPKNTIQLQGESAETMLKLMEALDDHDDVQNVYANFDIDEKTMESLGD